MESFFLITKKLIGLSPSGFLANIFATTHFVYLIRRVEELVGEDTSGFISLITQQATWTRSSGSQVVGQVASLGQNCSSAGFWHSDSHFGRAWGTFFPKLPIERNQGKYFKTLRISFESAFCGFPMDRLSFFFLATFFPSFFGKGLVRWPAAGGRKTINAPWQRIRMTKREIVEKR